MEEINEQEWERLVEHSMNFDKEKQSKSNHVVPTLLKILAILSIFGCVIACAISEYSFSWIYLILALPSALMWWALAIIVDACQMYMDAKSKKARS